MVPGDAIWEVYLLTGNVQSVSDTTHTLDKEQWCYVNFGEDFHETWGVDALPFRQDELTPA